MMVRLAKAAPAALMLLPANGWVMNPNLGRLAFSGRPADLAAAASGGAVGAGGSSDDEPDLFDYFDPLLSPHAYPNGISPEHKPNEINESVPLPVMEERPQAPRLSLEKEPLSSPQRPSVETSPGSMHTQFLERQQQIREMEQKQNTAENESEKDLFEYFDPLLSPHAYPNGISPDQKPQTDNINQKTPSLQAIPSMRPLQPKAQPSSSSSSSKLGILLMDHGSRNAASNDRLMDLARLYQQTLSLDGDGRSVVVEAAHMEIASPSIPDGLRALLDQGVDEIVCHPYFLSPGRHVREDIPEIVESAIAEMNIQIPVRTTDPVGSNTQLMIGAIHSLVRETSTVLRND